MNSAEDILQDVFMRDRNTIHAARPGKLQGLKKLMRAVGVSFIPLPFSAFYDELLTMDTDN